MAVGEVSDEYFLDVTPAGWVLILSSSYFFFYRIDEYLKKYSIRYFLSFGQQFLFGNLFGWSTLSCAYSDTQMMEICCTENLIL